MPPFPKDATWHTRISTKPTRSWQTVFMNISWTVPLHYNNNQHKVQPIFLLLYVFVFFCLVLQAKFHLRSLVVVVVAIVVMVVVVIAVVVLVAAAVAVV